VRRTLATLVVASLALPLWASPAGAGGTIAPAQLGPGTTVSGLTTFSNMAVSTEYVFLAEGSAGSQVAILDLDGTQVDTIDNVPAPMGVAVTGTTLYVAAMNASAIYVYDASTMPATKIDTFSTLPVQSPTSLALAGGRLWFTGLEPDNGPHASLGSMTTGGTDLQAFYPPGYEYWQYYGGCGDISHSSFADDRLFVHGLGCGSPDALYLYDASAEPPARLADYGLTNWGSYGSQPVTVLPDGSGMVVGSNNGLAVRSLDDLDGPVFSYGVPSGWNAWGSAIASSSSGLLAANGNVGTSGDTGIVLWQVGDVAPVNGFQLPAGNTYVARHGLAFSADGSTLYAVVAGDGNIVLQAIDPDLQGTSLGLQVSANKVTFGDRVTLTATLSGPGAGQEISFRREADGVTSQMGTCTTGAGGSCTFTTKPSMNAKYRASFAGTDEWAASTSANVNVSVRASLTGRMLRAYGTSGDYSLYHERQRVFYSVTMKPKRPGKKIVITFQYNFGSGWKNGGNQGFKQGDTGTVTIYFASGSLPTGRYRLKGKYEGERLLLGGSSSWSYFRVTP
jgi:hypothetical protein